mgnify:CR=1 FL=1
MNIFYDKYIKYKKKYINLKKTNHGNNLTMVGGAINIFTQFDQIFIQTDPLFNGSVYSNVKDKVFAYLINSGFRITNIKEALTFVNIHEISVSNDLHFSTINKRYDTCYKYFGVSKNILSRYLEYKHQYYYRKYLFVYTPMRYWNLFISSLLNPPKQHFQTMNF